MADYFAVLSRTLSGFSDPKPQLRHKLYDRARSTISKQLETRTPQLSAEVMQAEMAKLETAITSIEQGYDPSFGLDEAVSIKEPVVEPEAKVEAAPAPEPAPEPEPESASVEPEPEPVASPAPDEAVFDATDAAQPDSESVTQPIDPYIDQAPDLTDIPPLPETVDAGVEAGDLPEQSVEDPYSQTPSDFPPIPRFHPPEEPDQPSAPTEPALLPTADADPLDEWAKEFSAAHEAPANATEQPSASMPATTDELPPATLMPHVEIPQSEPVTRPVHEEFKPDDVVRAAAAEFPAEQSDPVPMAQPQAPQSVSPQPTLTSTHVQADTSSHPSNFEGGDADPLVIPPAPGFEARRTGGRKKGGLLKWIILLLVLAGLAAAAWYAWENRFTLAERFGLQSIIDDPARPKPVKTITITPEPAPVETPAPAVTPEAEVPKEESRLGDDGQETNTAEAEVELPPAAAATGLEPATAAETDPAPQTDAAPATDEVSGPVTPAPTDATPPVSQGAILYEEGATAQQNSVDPGRVVWSVVQEATGNGDATEPAIRGRVDIPSRNVVLIMTIKRNLDRALPASHLIELIFAVPDEFSGGGIEAINRFVMKESEQGRGETLVAVPARIADGIFLIALNNLEEAKTKNETMLKERTWIDIPMQYRTGRRALMTLEKGIPGERVFKEVFDAWGSL